MNKEEVGYILYAANIDGNLILNMSIGGFTFQCVQIPI